ncbi:MAG: NAD(+) synthase [Gammaproteobacteria bacterium]|nr:NAD(+) synthase [Gammaproteobacteria bacterium]
MSIAELPRIALAQMNVRPGLPEANLATMLAFIDRARAAGVDLIAFPEMCLSGYILGDLWDVEALVRDLAAMSDEVCAASVGMTVLFGNVAVDTNEVGEDGRLRKFNAVHVCHDGRYVQRPGLPDAYPSHIQPKTLHPNYRYFDDDRYFYSLRKLALARGEPLSAFHQPFEVKLRGRLFRFGVQLCEDVWSTDYAYQGRSFNGNVLFKAQGAQAVFNLSASPWTWRKNEKRNRVVRESLAEAQLPYFYVNAVGAQNNGKNILVFDGDSTAYGADGEILARARPWCECLLDLGEPEVARPQSEVEARLDAIRTGIAHLDHVRGQPNRFLLGVSGGVDSALVVSLLSLCAGPERVLGVNMPTRFNSDITQSNADKVCGELGVRIARCPIQGLYENLSATIKDFHFGNETGEYSRLVDENLQARIRGADVLAGLAAKFGLIFTNNGNKTETALGYATLYGDVNGAVAPIADLFKTEVFELCVHLNESVFGREVIPYNLLDGSTVPSAELSEAQDVTKGLGDPIRYDYHDKVLRELIEGRRHVVDILQWFLDGSFYDRLQIEPSLVRGYFQSTAQWVEDLEWLDRQLRINYFKRIQAPPIIVLSKRAFGFDLRESQLPAYRPRSFDSLKAAVLAKDRM